MHLFPFLVLSLCFISFQAPTPADLAALFLPQPLAPTRSRVSSLRRSRFRVVRSYSRVPPFRDSAPFSSPVTPCQPLRPLHLLGRSLRREIRLPSERNQSPCTKRCATPRAIRKLESAWRHTRFSHFRSPFGHARARASARARARVRCTELRNPGIHAEPDPRRWRGACMSTHDRVPVPLLRPGRADVPLCSSTTSTPAVAVAHVINRGLFYRASPTSLRAYHDVPFYCNFR